MDKAIEDQLRSLAELSLSQSTEASPVPLEEPATSYAEPSTPPGSRGRWILVAAMVLLIVALASTALAIGRDRSSESGPSVTTTATEPADPDLLGQMRLLAEEAKQAAGMEPTEVTAVVTTAQQAEALIGSSSDCLPSDQLVLYQYGFGQEFTYERAHGPTGDSSQPTGRALLLSRPGPPGSRPQSGCVTVGLGVLPEPADLSTLGTPVTLYFTPEPNSVHTRLDLASTTIVAGDTVQAQVIVNNEGHPFDVVGCISLFGAAVSTEPGQSGVPSLLCAQTFVIPTGESSWPVTVPATYLSCTPQQSDETTPTQLSQGGAISPACGPGRTMPPLPPGTYSVTVGGPDDLPAIDPVEIQVK